MIQTMNPHHTRQPLVFAEGPTQPGGRGVLVCQTAPRPRGKPYPANIFLLQTAARCCRSAKVPCKLQQTYVAEQLFPADCSSQLRVNICFLQIAAGRCCQTLASATLQRAVVF